MKRGACLLVAFAFAAVPGACGSVEIDPAQGWTHVGAPGVRVEAPIGLEIEVPPGWTYRCVHDEVLGERTVLTREGLALDVIEIAYVQANELDLGELGRRWPELRELSLRDVADLALGVQRQLRRGGTFTVLERRAGTLLGQPACRLRVLENRRPRDEVDVVSEIYAQARGPGLLLCTLATPELRADAQDLADFERIAAGPGTFASPR